MNVNKAIIVGRLTRDPEARTLPSGRAVSNFGVATNRVWTNQETNERQEQVEFHNVVAFGKRAEICNQYLTKGSLIFIEGRLQTRTWEGQDGVRKNRTEIVVENMQMGPRAQGRPRPEKVPTVEIEEDIEAEHVLAEEEKQEKPAPAEDLTDEQEIKVEDIPF